MCLLRVVNKQTSTYYEEGFEHPVQGENPTTTLDPETRVDIFMEPPGYYTTRAPY